MPQDISEFQDQIVQQPHLGNKIWMLHELIVTCILVSLGPLIKQLGLDINLYSYLSFKNSTMPQKTI